MQFLILNEEDIYFTSISLLYWQVQNKAKPQI